MHNGKEYAVSFPFGETRIYTLREIHNTVEPNQPCYTFIDKGVTMIVTNAVAERLTIKPVQQEPKARFMMLRQNPLTGLMEEKEVYMHKKDKNKDKNKDAAFKKMNP
jgi:hypothetical protein